MAQEKKLKEAMGLYQTANADQKYVLESLFPELRESEDDKMRKKLIHLVKKSNEYGGYALHKWEADEMLAWLEKQKPEVNVAKFKPGDKVTNAISTYTIDSIEGNHYRCKDDINITFNLEYRWKLVENAQKPETPFHEGDWIVQENIGVYKVIEVCESWYEVIDIENNHYSIGFDKEYMCHLWSIKDANTGDVLSNGSNIFMLHFISAGRLMSYCHINIDNGRFYNNTGKYECFYFIDMVVKPATKEQRELLFQKMHEAGYTFDFEKKELKEIHVIDEGKAEMDYCFTKMMNGEKVSQTWTEDDEEFLNRAIKATEHKYPLTANWLKTFKQRFTWKPSYEQLEALWCAAEKELESDDPNVVELRGKVLESLYNELKKMF